MTTTYSIKYVDAYESSWSIAQRRIMAKIEHFNSDRERKEWSERQRKALGYKFIVEETFETHTYTPEELAEREAAAKEAREKRWAEADRIKRARERWWHSPKRHQQ